MRSNRVLLAGLVLLLPGCALITQGTSQKVTFESDPTRAEIWLNNVKQPQLTPATIELPKGEYVYEIRKTGRIPKQGTLKTRTCSYFYWSLLMGVLAGGIDWISGAWVEFDIPEADKDTIKVDLPQNLESSEHSVAFSSNPPGATIFIDGMEQQEKAGIPGKGTLINIKWKSPTDQTRKVVMSYVNFQDGVTPLRRGVDKKIHLDLIPKPIVQNLNFESDPPGAAVFLDGIPKGTTPTGIEVTRQVGDLVPRTVEFRMTGYTTQTRIIRNAEHTKVSMKLVEEIETAFLKVECLPSGADFEIDGKALGSVPPEIKLNWSVKTNKSHKLKFSRPGYEPFEVTVEDNQRATPVSVRLKPALPRLP